MQRQLRDRGTKTFNEIDELMWKELLEEAAAEVSSVPLPVSTLWRNPDVTIEVREFEVRKDFKTTHGNDSGVCTQHAKEDKVVCTQPLARRHSLGRHCT